MKIKPYEKYKAEVCHGKFGDLHDCGIKYFKNNKLIYIDEDGWSLKIALFEINMFTQTGLIYDQMVADSDEMNLWIKTKQKLLL